MVEATTPLKPASEGLPLADLGKKIKSEHESLALNIRNIVDRAIRIGEDLNNAKRIIGHGSFLKWVKLNCAMTNKTAERYMKLAAGKDKLLAKLQERSRGAEDKFESISNLSLAQAERLIADPRNRDGEKNDSDAYDKAEGKLIEKLEALSLDVAEAAVAETVGRLNHIVEGKKKIPKAA